MVIILKQEFCLSSEVLKLYLEFYPFAIIDGIFMFCFLSLNHSLEGGF